MGDSRAQLDSILRSVAETRGKLDATEDYWKRLRQESKSLALQLVFDHGYSVNKTALVTGHHRNTIKVWIEASGVTDGEADAPRG